MDREQIKRGVHRVTHHKAVKRGHKYAYITYLVMTLREHTLVAAGLLVIVIACDLLEEIGDRM